MKDDEDHQQAALRPSHHRDDEAFRLVALRWLLAALCVLVFYGGGVYAAINWLAPATAAVEIPAAIMIEMSPVAEAPEEPPQDVALGPTMEMSQAATPAEQQDKPDAPPPEVQPETKTEVELPPLPEKNTEAVLAQPAPSDPGQQSKQQRKPERPKTAKSRPETRAARDAAATAAPQAADARRASVNAAPMAGTSSSVSPANWRSMVMALLNRHKRLPPGGSRGTATVAFTIDRSGRVGAARLIGSSGDPILDQEAVALARRVSPLPPPPADVAGGASILLSVPVSFGD